MPHEIHKQHTMYNDDDEKKSNNADKNEIKLTDIYTMEKLSVDSISIGKQSDIFS